MAKGRELEDRAYEALVRAGFPLVERQPAIATGSRLLRPDLLAWAVDDSHELMPWAAVELGSANGKWRPELVGPQFAQLRDVLGTVEHYALAADGQWYRADRALQRFEPVSGPVGPPSNESGTLSDERLVEALLSRRLWSAADRLRSSHGVDSLNALTATQIREFASLHTEEGREIAIAPQARWRALRRSALAFTGRTPTGQHSTSDPVVTSAVVQLAATRLTSTVLDPFCGLGTFLWEAVDVAREQGMSLERAVGVELNMETADMAQAIAEAAPTPSEVVIGDAFRIELDFASAVVSSPPMGMRLQEPYRLVDGRDTRDGDLAAIDRALSALAPGGRAVVQVAPGVAFRQTATAYRSYLASQFRIAAVIGLPSGAVPGAAIGSLILVIDRADPTDTFIAQLGDDWRDQIAPGGAALAAALEHVNGNRS